MNMDDDELAEISFDATTYWQYFGLEKAARELHDQCQKLGIPHVAFFMTKMQIEEGGPQVEGTGMSGSLDPRRDWPLQLAEVALSSDSAETLGRRLADLLDQRPEVVRVLMRRLVLQDMARRGDVQVMEVPNPDDVH